MTSFIEKQGNIVIEKYLNTNKNIEIMLELRDKLSRYMPQTTTYSICIRSIHNDEDICFNGTARELLYAIRDCCNFSVSDETRELVHSDGDMVFFRESMYGKALIYPVCKYTKEIDFSKLEKYFRYYFKKRIELIAFRTIARNPYKDYMVYMIAKNEAFSNYESVFYLKNVPFELKQHIRSYLVCTYESLTKLRILYDNINNI